MAFRQDVGVQLLVCPHTIKNLQSLFVLEKTIFIENILSS